MLRCEEAREKLVLAADMLREEYEGRMSWQAFAMLVNEVERAVLQMEERRMMAVRAAMVHQEKAEEAAIEKTGVAPKTKTAKVPPPPVVNMAILGEPEGPVAKPDRAAAVREAFSRFEGAKE